MNNSTRDELDRIRSLSEAQHGLVHRRQLANISSRDRRRAVRRQLGLVEVSGMVYRLAGSPRTPLQTVMAAVLDAGVEPRLSHTSSAALWSVPGFHLEPVHAVADRDRTRRSSPYLAVVHRPRLLLPEHATVFNGIPVTTPARTIIDLASMGLHRKRIERALDNLWVRGLVDGPTMRRTFASMGTQGRKGSAVIRDLLSERPDDYIPTESNLEFRFKEILERAGEEPLDRQVNVGSQQSWLGRVDFVDRQVRLIVQVNSALYHTALCDQRKDAEQRAALEAAGWIVLVVTDVDVWHRADHVVNAVRAARAKLRRTRAA